MKLPSSLSKLLENKYVLYIVFFLAVANLLGYLATKNYNAIVLFILAGYLVHHFNKNMILVLLVPLILTSLFVSSGIIKEGLENNANPANGSEKDKKPGNKSANADDSKNVAIEKTTGAAIVDKKTVDGSGNPIPTPKEEKFTTVYNKKNNRIDYASTVEDAYGDLTQILGGDGIKNLTADTQKLMEQQLQLANAMKSMTPLLEQAKSLIGGFDMKNFGNITEMAKQFQASGSN